MHVDEAMTAFRNTNPVPPCAYDHDAAGPQATETLRRILSSPPGRTGRPVPQRPVMLATVTAAAAAAAVAVPLATAGGTGPAGSTSSKGGTSSTGGTSPVVPRTETAAYTVTSNPNGTVTIVIRHWQGNLTGLSKALAEHGLRNRVLTGHTSCTIWSRTLAWPPGRPYEGERENAMIVKIRPDSWTVRPDLMPKDSILLLSGAWTAGGNEWPLTAPPLPAGRPLTPYRDGSRTIMVEPVKASVTCHPGSS